MQIQRQHQRQRQRQRECRGQRPQSLNMLAILLLLMALPIQKTEASPSLSYLTTPKTILTWVNGIGHNLDHMSSGQTSLSSIFGGKMIRFCHNPTAMANEDDTKGFYGDLRQATSQKYMGKVTDEVNSLVKHIQEAVNDVGPKGKVIHIAHSQGALITNLAANNLTKAEMSQVEVLCFGGAVSIHRSEERPFARCVNYYSVNDPLLLVNPGASRALRTGVWGMGSGSTSGSGLAAMVDPLTEPEFVFLTPRGNDPIVDHGLLGPTYIDALRWEGRRYQSLYLPLWHPFVRMVMLQTQCMGQFTSDSVNELIVKRIIVPFVMFVMAVNAWVKNSVILPIVLFFVMIWEAIREGIRIWKGDDIYEQVLLQPTTTSSTDTTGKVKVEKETHATN